MRVTRHENSAIATLPALFGKMATPSNTVSAKVHNVRSWLADLRCYTWTANQRREEQKNIVNNIVRCWLCPQSQGNEQDARVNTILPLRTVPRRASIHRDQWGTRVSAWWSFMLPLCFSRHRLQQKNLQIMMNWWFIPSRRRHGNSTTRTTEAFLHSMFLVRFSACVMLPPSVHLWGLLDQTELVLLSRCTEDN